jgi:predicted ATPase
LCDSADRGDVQSNFAVLWGLWVFHKVRSDLPRAREMAERLLAMASETGDAALLLQAHQAVAVTALCLGDPAVTRDHMRRASAIYDPQRHAANTQRFGQDPGVATIAMGAVALWLLNDDGDAVRESTRAIEIARQTSQPSSIAMALHFAAMLHQLRGDPAETCRLAQLSIDLAAEEGFNFWLAGAKVLHGWARAASGDAKGLDEIREGLDAWLAIGSKTYLPYYLGLLADAQIAQSRMDEASRTLDDALAAARSLNEGLYEAELLRLKAATLTDPGAAKKMLMESIALAKRQGARALEARCTADLERLTPPAASPSAAPRGRR